MKAEEYSRRDALFGLFRRAPEVGPRTAVIQGRFCLAYRSLACSVCAERCPEPGAIVRERGIPRVVADACTGCGVCHDVCPAPRNAVLVMPRPPAPMTAPRSSGIQR